ncbi:MAG: hypothetical protein KF749_09825 [Bacteroidetes bacterium]|nr:hypothetical protein [Bacteroidota bacterium]MCW5895045.1 hypothetical protein [Bacteroidota bacterium]
MPLHTQHLRIVVVGIEASIKVLRTLLAAGGSAGCRLYHVQQPAELISLSSDHPFNLIVFVESSRNSVDLSFLGLIREHHPAVPTVILNERDPEEVRTSALRQGVREALLNTLVADDAVAAAEDRGNLRRMDAAATPQGNFEQVAQMLQSNHIPEQIVLSPERLGLKPLSETMPYKFLELVRSYGNVLVHAAGRSANTRGAFSGHSVSLKLQFLASDLGDLKAGVRDVLDLHTKAVEGKPSNTIPKEQSRQILLELVTDLVSYYRQAADSLR